ncbi:MAG: DUF2723 domain-containing protein, partial [FCB group bacterium]|nr:DUF2723 domain-containing protein [FCB group bacterium]
MRLKAGMKNYFSKLDKVNALIAFLLWVFALVIYSLTKAPTLSFWDCGEFIAVGSILGIPHPPGSPLYVLIARLFSLIPFSTDVAVRINMLSVISSSLAVLLAYLTTVRMIKFAFKGDASLLTRIIIYAGGVSGALFLGFGLTSWNNAVEAEVYGLSMMMFMAILWLTMIYMENRDTAFGSRLMLLIFFIAFAGIGVHMTTFMVMPIVVLFFILKKETPPKIWFVVATFFILELYLVFATSSRPGEIPYYIPLLIVTVFYLFYVFSYEKIPALYLYVGGGFLLAILPFFGFIVNALKKISTVDQSLKPTSILSTVGILFFVALLVTGFFLLLKYFSAKKKNQEQLHYIITALFIFIAGVMTGLLYVPKGYFMFLLVSLVLLSIIVIVIGKYIRWPILIATVCVSLIILGVMQFLWGLVVGAVAILIAGIFFKQAGWKNALLIILMAIIGFSDNLFIPIRSACQPDINENNPSRSFTATKNFIERKQYGSQSMVTRMFKRRAEWVNQFGNYRRMGFWRFFNEQYGLIGNRFIILFVIGLFGIWELIRRKTEIGTTFLILLLITSVGLVLYMNFADGTRQSPVTGADYIEVRDRDYFFTPVFMLFGLAIGGGLTFFINFLREMVNDFTPWLKKVVIVSSLVFFLLPSFSLARNYYYANRSHDYIPFDYAWNIFMSTDKNAVLFTAGDNDTFPLWCLQEAYRIRRDIKVVNLSLANTKWYIKQLKSIMGIDLGWSDEQIDRLRPFRTRQGEVFRLQDQVVSEIIKKNFGKRPIEFCITVPSSARKFEGKSIDSMLVLNGMAWRMTPNGSGRRIDIDASVDLFTNPQKFRFRSIADPNVYKDEATRRITINYTRSFMRIADTLRKEGDGKRLVWLMKQAIKYVPYSTDAINYLAAYYSETGMEKDFEQLITN